ncbi:MAG: endonuclease/exonuclease/phosphatase family protein, partial [Bacteroidota bacterium]
MRSCIIYVLLFILISLEADAQQTRQYKIVTIAFYNLENLFHPSNDPLTYDDDRTPTGKDRWTMVDYQRKLTRMARVISQIGTSTVGTPPTVVGVCEIENKTVLQDLIAHEILEPYDYGIVHFDSPDRRGIDVALLYRKRLFTPISYQPYPLKLHHKEPPYRRIYTRDQLLVSGVLDGEKMHFIVNHWPSRSGGELSSSYKRMKAALLNRSIIDSIFSEEPYAKVITMGDLNDDPLSDSVLQGLRTEVTGATLGLKQLFNPFERLFRKG